MENFPCAQSSFCILDIPFPLPPSVRMILDLSSSLSAETTIWSYLLGKLYGPVTLTGLTKSATGKVHQS